MRGSVRWRTCFSDQSSVNWAVRNCRHVPGQERLERFITQILNSLRSLLCMGCNRAKVEQVLTWQR